MNKAMLTVFVVGAVLGIAAVWKRSGQCATSESDSKTEDDILETEEKVASEKDGEQVVSETSEFETGDLVLSDIVAHTMLVKSGTTLKLNEELYNFVQRSFERFKSCDWGDFDNELNQEALINGGELIGSYEEKKHHWTIMISTGADRKTTMIMHASEY